MKLQVFLYLSFFIFSASFYSVYASEWYNQNYPSLPAPEVVGTIGLRKDGEKVFYKKLVARNWVKKSTALGDCYLLHLMNYVKNQDTYEVRCHRVLVTSEDIPFFLILPQLGYDGDPAQKRFEEIEKCFKQQED